MYVDILILAQLVSQPCHGYQLKQFVENQLGSSFTLNNSQLYPTLRRFEEMGAISREVKREIGRPDRHIYSITDRGIEVLQQLLLDFPSDLAHQSSEFETRFAFFHLLDREARHTILATRRKALQSHLQHLKQIKFGMHADTPTYPYASQLLEFRQQQILQEVSWIDMLLEDNLTEAHNREIFLEEMR